MESVWLIHNNIPPYRVPLFAEIAKRAEFGFRVVLTSPRSKHRPHWQIRTDALPFTVVTLKGVNIRRSDDSSLSVSLGLFPSLIRDRPDVVICNGFSLSAIQVYLYARVFRKKYVIWSEATSVTEHRVGGLRKWFRRVLARHAGAFIDAGTLSREYIQSLLPRAVSVPFFRSYNCVDASLFTSGWGNDVGDQGSRQPSKKLLFVGQLIERKGVRMLLDVYREVLKQSSHDVRLVLLGDGPLRGEVERFMRDTRSAKVELHGQVPYADTGGYYRESSAFILLSLWDCNPLVLFEALHAGIPLICSDRAGNACDFIVPGENGYIVDPADKESIVRCVREVLGWDAEKRRKAALASKRLAATADYFTAAQAFLEACRAAIGPRAQDRP